MAANPKNILNYKIDNIDIVIEIDNRDLYKSLTNYISLPPGSSLANNEQYFITHTIIEDRNNNLDQLLPLPDDKYKIYERSLLAEKKIPYKSYRKEKQSWTDFINFGRSWINFEESRGKAVIVKDNGLPYIYADIIFGYNMLLSLLSNFGYITVHASCVQINGKGLLFTGDSGSGKSTAAYALLRKGHFTLADDRILLKKDTKYRALSISDVIKVNTDAPNNFFPELKQVKPFHQDPLDSYYKIAEIDEFKYLNNTDVEYLMIFERTGKPESRIEKINPTNVVGNLFPVTMSDLSPQAMQRKFNFLMDFLEKIHCYRVFFGTDMIQFATMIENLIKKAPDDV